MNAIYYIPRSKASPPAMPWERAATKHKKPCQKPQTRQVCLHPPRARRAKAPHHEANHFAVRLTAPATSETRPQNETRPRKCFRISVKLKTQEAA